MKKYLIFLLIPVCLLWGCQKEEMGTKTYSISETEESSYAISYYDGEKTVTEEGVLFPVEDQGGGILTYYDYVQEESYPFCSNVNCEHNDSSCSAWFDSFAEAPGIYSGQIYVFSYLNEADEWNLISMDVDGTNRKTVAKFSPEDFACDSLLTGVSASWYIDGNSVFVISCTSWEEDAMDFRAVVKVDLKNGNKEILTEIGDEDNVIGIYNDVLLISRKNPVTPLLEQEEFFETNGKQADYDAYYNEWYESSYRETYYTLNWSTGETKDLFDTIGDVPEWDYSRISSDGMFYYSMGKKISGVNLISGEMETVYEDENEITMECTADGNLFFQTLSDDRNKKVSDCYLNLETGEVKELSQNMPDGSWIYSETSKYFIGNGPINLKFNYIFIPKEDYYSSNYDAAIGIKVIE